MMNNLLFYEDQFPNQYNGMDGQSDPQEQQPPQPTVEFEQIKRVVLYIKFKNILMYLKRMQLLGDKFNNNELEDFVNLILVYYDEIQYPDLVMLLNNLIDTISNMYGIKVATRFMDQQPQQPEPQQQQQQQGES